MSLALSACAALALLYGPGLVIAYAWGLRGLRAWGAAPAVSAGIIGLGTWWVRPWFRPEVFLYVCVATLALMCVGVVFSRGFRLTDSSADWRTWLPAAALACAVVASVLPLWWGTGGMDSPAQASDAVYHLSAVRFVREQGHAGPLGGLASMYDGARVYYPTLWHALVALMPGSVVSASNMMIVVVAGVVFPSTMAALLTSVGSVMHCHRVPRAAAIAVSASPISVVLIASSVWPYTLSMALVPGALSLGMNAVEVSEDRQRHSWRVLAGYWGLVVVAVLGVVSAHGSGAFTLLVLGGPVACAVVYPQIMRLPRSVVWGGLGGVTALLVGATWVMRAPLRSVFGFQRGAGNLAGSLFGLLVDHPQLGHYSLWLPGNIVVSLLALLGAVVLWKGALPYLAYGRSWVISAGLSVTLVLLAGGPQWPGRVLAGPWYTQRARIIPLVTVVSLILVLVACEWIYRGGWRAWLSAPDRLWGRHGERVRKVSGTQAVGAVVVVSLLVAPAWRWGLKQEIFASIHDPQAITYGAMLSSDERELIERARRDLPADALVLGEPSSGAPYLWSVSGIGVVYPSRPAPGGELEWLAEHVADIRDDPRVCGLLRQRGIEYYYSDDAVPDGRDGGVREPLWRNELRDLPRDALTLIDSQGQAALWRIDVCH